MMKLKPYPEYKDSGVEWLGEVPEHWEIDRLKRKLRSIIEQSTSYRTGELSLALEHVESWTGRIHPPAVDQTFESQVKRFKYNDILFGKLRPYLAKVARPTQPGVCVGEFLVLRAIDSVSLPEFWECILRSAPFIDLVNSATYGAKMPRAEWSFIGKIIVPIPTTDEQRQIANFLDAKTRLMDRFIRNKGRLIELLQEQKQAVINDCVTGKMEVRRIVDENGNSSFRLQPSSCKMRDSGIDWLGEIPEHWEVLPFRRVCYLNQGLQIAQAERFYEPGPNRYKYITVKFINQGMSKEATEYIENPPPSVICEEKDVLLARTGATGAVITDQSGVFHNNFFRINYNSMRISRDFLVYYLKNNRVKEVLLLKAGLTTIPDLNHNEFLETQVVLPNVIKQTEIVEYLDQEMSRIDQVVGRINEQIDLIQEYRTRLIADVVTGKVDVRGIPVEDVAED